MKKQKQTPPTYAELEKLAWSYRKRIMRTRIALALVYINLFAWIAPVFVGIKTYKDYQSLFIKKEAVKTVKAKVEPVKELSVKEYIEQEVKAAGLDWYLVDCTIRHESNYNPKAWNANTNDTVDVGVWQGNSVHFKTCDINCMLDYKQQTKWAINKIKKDGGLGAWYGSRQCQ